MRNHVLTAVLAVAALGFADSAHAQVIFNRGYSQSYYGGYSPGYYGNGGVVQSGGTEFYYGNSYGYSPYQNYGFNYNYNSFPTYSGSSNYSPALDAYYSFYRRGSYGNSYPYGGRRWR